ncbi:MAG TPA: UDP-N-acetylmuramate dehydrogenase [Patescibacteria group bacterium]|nr:UDP-N-acetylmuramate dehydrogenase [Patescibacteria group bacterium]
MMTQKNISLESYTTFHIGGPADEFVIVHSADELTDAVLYAKEKKISYFILGSGANILVGDKGFRGLVIKNESDKIETIETKITAESGVTISHLIEIAKEKGLSGFEHFAGIPSTVGGALWQNLHFLSPDRTKTVFIADILESAVILTEEGEQKKVEKDYFQFGYDESILHSNHAIVLSATFSLKEKKKEEIEKVIEENISWRKEKHPENAVWTSAGSVFKKIEGHGAGRLIEQVGLKGYQIGGAKISEKHANFIVNADNATADDVMRLIDLVKEKVHMQLGLTMETEISFVGQF